MKKLVALLALALPLFAQNVQLQKTPASPAGAGANNLTAASKVIVVPDGGSVTATGTGVIISTGGAATSVPWSGVTGTPTTLVGYGVMNTLAATAPLTGGGLLSANLSLSMPPATSSANGYLTSADWVAFNAKQPAGNYLTALTGDVSASGPGSAAATLAIVATAGTTGSSTAIPVVTIDAKGRTTSISTSAVVAPAGTLTGATLASNVLASSLTSVGTLTGGATGAGFTLALGSSTISGTLGVTNGGNGLNTAALGDLRYGSAPNTLAAIAGNTSATTAVLTQTGNGATSAAPVWTSTTGTGNVVRATSPTLVAPTLGVATATSLNGLTISTTTGTLSLANSSTFATVGGFTATLTFTGTTGVTFPTSGTLATTAGTVASLTGTANQVLVNGTSGSATTGAITLTTPQSIATTSSPTFAGLTITGGATSGNINIFDLSAGTGISDQTNGTNTVFGVGAFAGTWSAGGSPGDGGNAAFGYQSLAANTRGAGNSAFGQGTARANTTGNFNTVMGDGAYQNATTGSQNTAIGHNAGYGITTSSYNTAVGDSVLVGTGAGASNTGMGYSVLNATTGSGNTAFGHDTLNAVTSGSNNVAIGGRAGNSTTTSSSNVFVGDWAGGYATAGNEFYLNNQDRGSLANDQAKSLLYGTFNSTASSQTLTANVGTFTVSGGSSIASRTALTTTSTDGVVAQNTTVSTSGVAVQYSPRIRFTGHAWNTTATAADNYLEAINELRPVSGTTPTSTMAWAFRRSTDGSTGSYTDAMTLTSAGVLSVLGAATSTFTVTSSNDLFLNASSAGAGVQLQTNSTTYLKITSSSIQAQNNVPFVAVDTQGYRFSGDQTSNITLGGGSLMNFTRSGTLAMQINSTAVAVQSGFILLVANTTVSTSTTTGSLTNAGGFGNSGSVYIGGSLNVVNSGNVSALVQSTAGGASTFTVKSGNNLDVIFDRGATNVTAALRYKTAGTNEWMIATGALGTDVDLTFFTYGGPGEVLRLNGTTGKVSVNTATEATTGGAGSLTTAGGIYAAKKLITASTLTTAAGVTYDFGADVTGVTTTFVATEYLAVIVNGSTKKIALVTSVP